MAALPATVVVTGELRALTIYSTPPTDCRTLPVLDDAFAPHLKASEAVVHDPDDREPVSGEIYVVRIASPFAPDGYKLAIVQLRARECRFGTRETADEPWRPGPPSLGWMMHFTLIRHYGRRLTLDEVVAQLRAGRLSVCEGPVTTGSMREHYIVGRAVGVVLPPPCHLNPLSTTRGP